jgi:hypothetical protein
MKHKCKGVRVIYESSCECGWRSDQHFGGKFGDGGRAAAYEDWREHRRKCEAAGEKSHDDK